MNSQMISIALHPSRIKLTYPEVIGYFLVVLHIHEFLSYFLSITKAALSAFELLFLMIFVWGFVLVKSFGSSGRGLLLKASIGQHC